MPDPSGSAASDSIFRERSRNVDEAYLAADRHVVIAIVVLAVIWLRSSPDLAQFAHLKDPRFTQVPDERMLTSRRSAMYSHRSYMRQFVHATLTGGKATLTIPNS